MSQEKFISELREALKGELPPSDIESQVRYYEDYFKDEIRAGKSEEEILNQLGSPRLIARTIIDSFKMKQTPWTTSGSNSESHYYNEDADYSRNAQEQQRTQSGQQSEYGFRGRIPWYYKVFGILILVFVISIVIAIGGAVLSIGLPILLIWAVIQMIIMLTRR